MIKWGILGAGNIAKKFVSDFSKVTNGKVLAVGSRSIDKSKAFAKEFNITKYYGSYANLLADKDIDIIYIATPHNFHFEQIKLCLNAELNVLCEKPITVNAKQFAELMVLANSKKLFLMEAMWSSFLPSIQKTMEWLSADKIGKVELVQANFGFKAVGNNDDRLFNPNLAGGALLDIGIYVLAIAQMVAKSKVSKIDVQPIFAATGVDKALAIQLVYENGMQAQLNCNLGLNLVNDVTIYGAKGHMQIPSFWMSNTANLFCDSGNEQFVDNRNTHGYNFEAQTVGEYLIQGKTQSDVVTHEWSMQLLELMDLIREKINLHYPFE